MWEVKVLNNYHSVMKEMGPHGKKENNSDPGGIRTHDLRNRSLLLHQSRYKTNIGQIGDHRWKLGW